MLRSRLRKLLVAPRARRRRGRELRRRPSSLRVDQRAKRRKTDRIDVETILRALIAWRHGARDECSMVVVPETAAEDERRLSRERGRMVQERTAHVNRIKGLLMTVGIYDVAPLAADWRARLAALVTGDGQI